MGTTGSQTPKRYRTRNNIKKIKMKFLLIVTAALIAVASSTEAESQPPSPMAGPVKDVYAPAVSPSVANRFFGAGSSGHRTGRCACCASRCGGLCDQIGCCDC